MSDTAWAPDLKALAEGYEVLGELRGSDRLRSYVGHRRSDGADVVILVARAPKGGENNELTHFAADTQLLTNIGHPAMPRVLEGRWLGGDSVAVISERVRGSTLSAATSGDEPLAFPRVAAVLQQVHGVMEWARSHGVVHRGVSLDSITVEDGSGRIMVSLVPTAIPMEGVPDACADARVLGALAFELLTGEPYSGDDPIEQMKELRPQLARRVQDEVKTMLQCQGGGTQPAPDVHTFIAMIAAADEMRVGEEERARLEAEMVQAHRLECEKWEAQRKALEERIADDERRLKLQQTALETSEAEHRDQLAADLAALETQRREADERTRVAEEQAERSEARAKELEVRSRELEVRAREMETRAKALDARETELRQQYAAILPPEELDDEAQPRSKSESIVAAAVAPFAISNWRRTPKEVEAVPDEVEVPAPVAQSADFEPDDVVVVPTADEATTPGTGRRSWTLPASVVGLVLLVGAGIAVARRGPAAPAAGPVRIGRTTVLPNTTPVAGVQASTARPTVADSAAGSVVPIPGADSAAQRAARDSVNAAAAAATARARAANASGTPTRRPAADRGTQAEPGAGRVYGPPAMSDSTVLVPVAGNVQVPLRAADSSRARRDTTPRDTTQRAVGAKRDTTPIRDTTARADTIAIRPIV